MMSDNTEGPPNEGTRPLGRDRATLTPPAKWMPREYRTWMMAPQPRRRAGLCRRWHLRATGAPGHQESRQCGRQPLARQVQPRPESDRRVFAGPITASPSTCAAADLTAGRDRRRPPRIAALCLQRARGLGGPYQSTRPDSPGRGHYIFAQPPGGASQQQGQLAGRA